MSSLCNTKDRSEVRQGGEIYDCLDDLEAVDNFNLRLVKESHVL